MDGPTYGNGGGTVEMSEFEEALDSIPELTDEEHEQDPIGMHFLRQKNNFTFDLASN